MTWNASQILWQEQVLVLLILLPPIFISAILLALNAPRLVGMKPATGAGAIEEQPAPQQSARAA